MQSEQHLFVVSWVGHVDKQDTSYHCFDVRPIETHAVLDLYITLCIYVWQTFIFLLRIPNLDCSHSSSPSDHCNICRCRALGGHESWKSISNCYLTSRDDKQVSSPILSRVTAHVLQNWTSLDAQQTLDVIKSTTNSTAHFTRTRSQALVRKNCTTNFHFING